MNNDTKDFVCIVCPMGCRLKVSGLKSGNIIVEGNACKRGEIYAKAETTNPVRTIPSTVAISGAFLSRLPVKTAKPVPKNLIMQCMEEIKLIKVSAPIKIGDVVAKNLAGTGIDLVATRTMPLEK